MTWSPASWWAWAAHSKCATTPGRRGAPAWPVACYAPITDYLLYWSIAPGANAATDGLTLSVVTKNSPGLRSRLAWPQPKARSS
jgi:hypothetical protein